MYIYADGGCIVGKDKGAISFIICDSEHQIIKIVGVPITTPGLTNNRAEYMAIYFALTEMELDYGTVNLYSDSELVIKQLNGSYEVKDDILKEYHDGILSYIKGDHIKVTFTHKPREDKYIKMCDKLNKMLMG